MGTLLLDLRYAARLLRKAPGFTFTAIIVIALGIGANSAIFSLVDTVLLRDLPYTQPQQIVSLWEQSSRTAHNRVSPLNFQDWSDQNQSFSAMAAVSGASRTLTGMPGGAERLVGQSVSTPFFDLLGVRPIAGRTFNASDAVPDSHVLVVSEKFWRSHLGGDPNAVGRTLTLDGQSWSVIGVVPANFQIFWESQIWTPLVVKRSPEQRRMHYLAVIGRLKPDVGIDQARGNMHAIGEGLSTLWPESNKGWNVNVEPLRSSFVNADLRATSWMLAGVAALVLLMGCANVAALLLARGVGRTREMAIRAALGGTARRIFQQLVVESMLLSTLGGAAGVALAWMILRVAPSLLPPGTLPVALTLSLDARVVAFAAIATLATGLLFGLTPALQAMRLSLSDTLRSGGRTATGGVWIRTALTCGEIAVAVMLTAGAGLLLHTLYAVSTVDPGFRANNVVTAQLGLPLARYKTPDRALAVFESVQRELSAIPGVKSVGMSYVLPLDGYEIGQGFKIPGETEGHSTHYQLVNPRYFETLGISVLSGRAFNAHDTLESQAVCIVNEEMVRRYFGGRDPVGKHIQVQSMDMSGPKPIDREIIGVSRQVKVEGLGERANVVEVYVPQAQNAWFETALAIQAGGDPLALVPALREAVARVDKDLPLTRVRTMDEIASETVAQPRLRATLVATFAALALVLSAVGVFGLMAFSVTARTREFGIRMALGAESRDVLTLVLRRGAAIAGIGVAAGLAGAVAISRLLATLLFGVAPLDPLAFIAAPALLTFVALAACAIPALRASRVNPAVALHSE